MAATFSTDGVRANLLPASDKLLSRIGKSLAWQGFAQEAVDRARIDRLQRLG
jgi:hypothetical protein